jgi:hypothetical protein
MTALTLIVTISSVLFVPYGCCSYRCNTAHIDLTSRGSYDLGCS